MKSRTVLFSFIVHAGVAVALLFAAEKKMARRATSVAVVSEEKKKEKPKEDKPPPPPPKVDKPKPRPVKMEAPTPTPAAPPPSAPAPNAPAPVDTGLTLGNPDGPGIDVGGPAHAAGAGEKQAKSDSGQGKKQPAPAPKKKDEIKPEEECQEDATKPEPISKTEIEYTAAARAAGVEGRLVLRVYIDKNGGVSKVDVVSSVDAQLDAAAIAAVEHWRFKPSTKCGKPIAGGIYTLARRFELGD